MRALWIKFGLFLCVWYEVSVELGLSGGTAMVVTLLVCGAGMMLLRLPGQILSLLGPRAVYAHGIHLDERDWRALHASGTAIAHCPTSNARLGSGIARLRAHFDQVWEKALGAFQSSAEKSASKVSPRNDKAGENDDKRRRKRRRS